MVGRREVGGVFNYSQGGGGRSRLAKTIVSVVEFSLANLLRPLLSHHRPVNDYEDIQRDGKWNKPAILTI
jgi:hypothetical protein